MAITMALLLVGLITILGLVEVGYLYWAHRNVQKVADLAALSGAQRLELCGDINGNSAAYDNATIGNHFPASASSSSLAITCGNWSPTIPGAEHFIASASTSAQPNAIKVVASRAVTPLFKFTKLLPNVEATAIATNLDPVAVFSINSQTTGIDPNSPLNDLLDEALGTSLGLGLLNNSGIAGADVSLLALVKNLSVNAGTLDSVLNTNLTVGTFLNAYLQTLSQQKDTANLDLSVLQQKITAITANLGNIPIHLGQILNVQANTSDPRMALDADVDALNILKAVVLAADSNNAIAIPPATIDVPGVATVNVMASVVEPPQIGVGGKGATAHTAQIRLALDLNPLPALNLVKLLGLNLLGLSVAHLSIALEVAPSDATITDITCNVPTANGPINNVAIKVTPGLLHVGIANYDYLKNAFDNTQQTWTNILDAAHTDKFSGWDKILNITVLVPIADIYLFTNTQLATTPPFTHTFEVNSSIPIDNQSGMTFPESLNDDPSTQTTKLISTLLGSDIDLEPQLLGVLPLPVPLGNFINALSPLLNNLLAPVLNGLVDPLLKALGVELGTAQVTLHSVNCSAGAQLVY